MAATSVRRTAFFLCDIQNRFRDLIKDFPSVIRVAHTLSQVANVVNAPLIVTEQYPKAFGHTVPELQPFLKSEMNPSGAQPFEKLKFSMLTDEVQAHLAERFPAPDTLESVVLFGIEAHVCVQQTALELLGKGVKVYLVVDGVSSQRWGDRSIALEQLKQAGAVLTTTESVIFTLLRTAGAPEFKQVQKIVIEHNRKTAAEGTSLDRLA